MNPVVHKLNQFAAFTAQESAALERLLTNVIRVPSGEFVREGEPATNIYFLLEGFVGRTKILTSGRRQILAFMLPGDSCDIGVSTLELRDHSLTATVPSRLAQTTDAALEHVMSQYPAIRSALQWATLQEEAIAREWIANVGQRSALQGMAHVFCELRARQTALAGHEQANFPLPLTQADLADALGMSAVHVNRVLQELRGMNLIAFADKQLTLLNLPRLEKLGQFDPTYLHFQARYHRQTDSGYDGSKGSDQLPSRR